MADNTNEDKGGGKGSRPAVGRTELGMQRQGGGSVKRDGESPAEPEFCATTNHPSDRGAIALRQDKSVRRHSGLVIEQKLFRVDQSPEDVLVGDSRIIFVSIDVADRNVHFVLPRISGENDLVQFGHSFLVTSF